MTAENKGRVVIRTKQGGEEVVGYGWVFPQDLIEGARGKVEEDDLAKFERVIETKSEEIGRLFNEGGAVVRDRIVPWDQLLLSEDLSRRLEEAGGVVAVTTSYFKEQGGQLVEEETDLGSPSAAIHLIAPGAAENLGFLRRGRRGRPMPALLMEKQNDADAGGKAVVLLPGKGLRMALLKAVKSNYESEGLSRADPQIAPESVVRAILLELAEKNRGMFPPEQGVMESPRMVSRTSTMAEGLRRG